MIDYKNTLIDLVKDLALEIKPEGEFFTLKSGEKSRFYLDCRKLTLHNFGLSLVVDAMWDILHHEIGGINAIGGPCIGADPIVGGLLYKAGSVNLPTVRGFLIRKEEKLHGKKDRVVGSIRPGDTCVLIEDVITTGSTSFEAIEILQKELNANVVVVLAIIDRSTKGSQLFKSQGALFRSLLTTKDLGIA